MSLTLEAWTRRLATLPTSMQPLALEAIQATARRGVNAAQSVVPVRTGRLQQSISVDSIEVTSRGAEAEYSAKTGYAKFVEEGTVHFGPRRFMLTSARIVTPKFRRSAEVIGVEALRRSLT